MKNKIIGNIIIIIGIIILLLAIFFFFYNAYEDYNAGIKSNEMLIDIKKYIKEEKKEEDNVNDTTSSKTSRYIKGYSYIGYITIPKINIELPIMDDWSYKKLKLSPCRHFGSISEDNLVIVAHAYRNHFKYIYKLEAGDKLTITDMNGNIHSYKVMRKELLESHQVELVKNSGYDLVLYTCKGQSRERYVVFCERL